jgi:hypothetical protein
MVQKSATFHTTYEIVKDATSWLHAADLAGTQL